MFRYRSPPFSASATGDAAAYTGISITAVVSFGLQRLQKCKNGGADMPGAHPQYHTIAVVACCASAADAARTEALLHDPKCPSRKQQQQQQQKQQRQQHETASAFLSRRHGKGEIIEGGLVEGPPKEVTKEWCCHCGFAVVSWDIRSSEETERAILNIEVVVRGALGTPRLHALIYGAGLWASFPTQVRSAACAASAAAAAAIPAALAHITAASAVRAAIVVSAAAAPFALCC